MSNGDCLAPVEGVRPEQLTPAVTLFAGDCLDVLKTLAPDSVDSCVCDPPYGLSFMGKAWDHGVPGVPYWKAVFRVLKPGAHLIAFGGTRTFGRMHVAIEDAGFEVRDMISWLYGSGFPKSLDVSKAIDKAAGAEREVVGITNRQVGPKGTRRVDGLCGTSTFRENPDNPGNLLTAPATDAAREWSGFGTALKPACEPIVLARKPLSESTVAANVLKWGTGALNIDGCRVASNEEIPVFATSGGRKVTFDDRPQNVEQVGTRTNGRWPANVIHDGSDEVVGAFPESGGGTFAQSGHRVGGKSDNCVGLNGQKNAPDNYGDQGSAARFFYTAKADADDRLGSKHPTVKPLDLMQYLVRLVTPPKGLVLDPFAGTGTTGEAALREGMRAILIEREAEYQEDIRRRMKLALVGPDERQREAMKAKLKDKPVDHGPLFGGTTPPAARADRFTATTPIKTNDWSDRTQVVTE